MPFSERRLGLRPFSVIAISFSLLATGAVSPNAFARSASVSGQLVGSAGYTVLALSPNGRAKAASISAKGTFSLPVSRGTTLQVVNPAGRYFGPIVLRRGARKAFTGFSGRSVKLGKIRREKGFAAPKKALAPSSIDVRNYSRANRKGTPMGAGRLGLVAKANRSLARAAADREPQPGADTDRDGIPAVIDADDNNNGALDAADRSTSGSGDGLFSTTYMNLAEALNVNADNVTTAAIDQLLSDSMQLEFYVDERRFGDATVSALNVDCGGLSYCASGSGTGLVSASNNTSGVAADTLWTLFDPDGNGLPNIPLNRERSDVFSIGVSPQAGIGHIGPGDTFQLIATTPSGTVSVPTSITFLFVTTPGLVSYDAGAGNTSVEYPVEDGEPGTDSNPIQMSSTSLTLTLWRPQRQALPGEGGGFRDIGGLHWGIPVTSFDGGREFGCGASAYSNPSSTLRASSSSGSDDIYASLFPLIDTAEDSAPSASRTLSFTLDLGACLVANGQSVSGQTLRLPVTAVDESRRGGTDRSAETIAVQLPPTG